MGHTNDYMIIGCKHYDSRKYYELINPKNPYKINIRLKPFLSSQCRNITAGVVLKNIDEVIRVQNDNVTFKTEQKNLNIEYLLPEEKTTGLIYFKNANTYNKIEK